MTRCLYEEAIMKVAVIGCTHAGTAAIVNTAKIISGSRNYSIRTK